MAQPSRGLPDLILVDLAANNPVDTLTAGRLFRAASSGSVIQPLVTGQRLPDSVAVDETADRIFWTCMGVAGLKDGSLWSSRIDGSACTEIIPRGLLSTPKQLAVHREWRKIYFCDREGLRIACCNYDGSDVRTVLETGDVEEAAHRADATRWCVGIALDPVHELLYWTQKGPSKGGKGRIFRASLRSGSDVDPRNRQDVECVLADLPEPVDLAIDVQKQRLYWTDKGDLPHGNTLNVVELTSFRDSQTLMFDIWQPLPYTVLVRNLHDPVGLKLDVARGLIYVVDMGGCVYEMDLNGDGKRKMFEHLEACFTGIDMIFDS